MVPLHMHVYVQIQVLTFGSLDGYYVPVWHTRYDTICLGLQHTTKGALTYKERERERGIHC